jgi:squalene synthase HpnC
MFGWMKTIPEHLAADYAYCQAIVQSHAENFPVGSWLAPRYMRPHLHAVYAFARTADDFADMPGRSMEDRLMLLDDWSRRLERAQEGHPDHPIFRALAHTLQHTQLPPTPLQELLIAFRMDVTNKTYETLEQLDEYCHYSANPVGRIVLYLAEASSPALFNYSDALCTALQLTNHWQDLGEDLWRGRPLYLPLEEMRRYGVELSMIRERRFTPAVGDLVLNLVDETRALYLEGQPLIHALNWPINLELAVTWQAGMKLLDMIEDAGGNTLRERPQLSARDWAACFRRALYRITFPS